MDILKMPHETPSLKIALIVVVLITSLVIFGLYSSKNNQITGATTGMEKVKNKWIQ